MRNIAHVICCLSLLLVSFRSATAAPALEVLGKDYIFPNKIDGFPSKLSEFAGLQINSFRTSDGVRLTYWEAGEGKPLVFIPGWAASGAGFVNVMFLLSRHYHVYLRVDGRRRGFRQVGSLRGFVLSTPSLRLGRLRALVHWRLFASISPAWPPF